MIKPYVVAIFTEGEFAGAEPHQTEECADSYAEGVRRGADEYGAGSCSTYVLPRDTADMRHDQEALEFNAAMTAYADRMEHQRVAAEHDE